MAHGSVKLFLHWGPHSLPVSAWLFTATALALGVTAAWRWQQARRRHGRRLKQVGTVAGLFSYPVKSCRGVAVKEAEVTRMGLRSGDLGDRCWTVVKKDGEMLSAKQEPRLVLISVTREDGSLTLNAPEMKALRISVELPRTNSVRNCRRFGVEAQGRDCGEEAAQWITTFLNSGPYRLAHYEPNMVTRKPRDFLPPFQPTDEVAYAEGSPILLISEASLDDLNSRLEKKVEITNFRPNIFVTGCTPYEEDSWSEILIGNVQMKGRMSCPRCILTTVDPNTGIMDKKEPLNTLKRSYNSKGMPDCFKAYILEDFGRVQKTTDSFPNLALPTEEVLCFFCIQQQSTLLKRNTKFQHWAFSVLDLFSSITLYRRCDPSEQHAFKSHPPFGWLYGIEKPGTLAVGDPVYKII